MKLGSNDIGSVYIGSTAVNKIYIGSTEVWTSNSGLLADYPGAAAAYSLRLLQTTYTGNAIRVRRASDNAESDIGFVSGQLDTSTLETFCSGTDGYVTTWYDQSGNGNDASNTTASKQPQIVSAGSTITENGKPALDFDGKDDVLNCSSNYLAVANISAFLIYIESNNSDRLIDTRGTGAPYIKGMFIRTQGNYSSAAQDNVSLELRNDISRGSNVQTLLSVIFGGNTLNEYVDGTFAGGDSVVSNVNISSTNNVKISGTVNNNGQEYLGKMQEIVLYASDQSSNRNGIETNINNHYNIY